MGPICSFDSLSKRNAMSTKFSQKILNLRLLLVITGGQKGNLSCVFKLKPITTYHLLFVMKILCRQTLATNFIQYLFIGGEF